MRGLFKKNPIEDVVVVKTKDELKTALKNKEKKIIAKGDAAKSLEWRIKVPMKKLLITAAVLSGVFALAAIPSPATPIAASFYGITATTASGAVVEITGAEAAVCMVSCGLSVALIIAVIKGYDVKAKGDEIILTAKK